MARSLASTVTPEANEVRRTQILSNANPAKRAGSLAIHTWVTRRPDRAARLLGLPYEPKECDLPYLESGRESTVFKLNATHVLKINLFSLLFTGAKQHAYEQKKNQENRALADHLGDFALQQSSRTTKHPFLKGVQALQIIQPYCDIDDPEFFSGSSPAGLAEKIQGLKSDHPDINDQLTEFLERSQLLYDHTRLLPDTNGRTNLILEHGGGLLMVDGQPIAPDQPKAQAIILSQLGSLGEAVALAA